MHDVGIKLMKQEIYRFLEIGTERQTGHNAKRITELAEAVGWVK